MISRRRRRARAASRGKLEDRFRSAYTYWWLYRTTAYGRALLLGLFLAGGLGGASVEMPLFRLFFTAFMFGAVALLAGILLRRRLEVSAELPEKAVAGQPLRVDLQVRNPGRLPAWHLGAGYFEVSPSVSHVSEPELPALAPGASARISASLTPLKRGIYSPIALRVYSTFPFHLFRFPRARPLRHSLLVLPSFHPLQSVDLPVGSRYQPGGIALTSQIGESPEYIGNREYRYGDPLRRVDFRAWARLAKPAVREYQEEYYCRIALVLDTQVPARRSTGPDGDPAFEAAVSLCAAIADVLARGEYILDLFAAGPQLYVFRAGRHTAHLENVLEILACVEPARGNPFETLTPAIAEELGSIAALLCVFLDWDPARERLLREAQDHGCAARAILVRDTPPSKTWAESGFNVLSLSSAEVRQGAVEEI